MSTTKSILAINQIDRLEKSLKEFFETQSTAQTIEDLSFAIRALQNGDEVMREQLDNMNYRFSEIMKLVSDLALINCLIQSTNQITKGERVYAS